MTVPTQAEALAALIELNTLAEGFVASQPSMGAEKPFWDRREAARKALRAFITARPDAEPVAWTNQFQLDQIRPGMAGLMGGRTQDLGGGPGIPLFASPPVMGGNGSSQDHCTANAPAETPPPPCPWISESESLPQIGGTVLLLSPRTTGDFWDLHVVSLLARYEGVVALPVRPGDKWPVDYYWGGARGANERRLITGEAYWAYTDFVPLVPGAYHDQDRGFHYIRAGVRQPVKSANTAQTERDKSRDEQQNLSPAPADTVTVGSVLEARLREALTEIRDMTDSDNLESYRNDDREGCLETVHSVASAALNGGENDR